MNILFITCEGYLGAGSTESISYLAKGLAEKGHNVYVGCKEKSYLQKLIEGSKAIAIPMKFTSKTSIAEIKFISEIVKEKEIDVINAQSTIDRYTTIFSKILFRHNAKIVHTRRQPPRSNGGALQRWFYVANTAKIVTVSDSLKELFVTNGYPVRHLHTIYNGIPEESFKYINENIQKQLREAHGIDEKDIVIGCVSRLKHQDQLVRALKYLDPAVKLILVGINPGYYDDLVKSEKIPNQIIYTGRVSRSLVMNYYKLFNVSVLPSTTDGFGLVLVEAMGSGIPVVATKSTGIIDVLDNQKNGLWFEDQNIEELSKKLEMAIYNKQLRSSLISNGLRAAYEKFNINKTISYYEKFFEEIIQSDNCWAEQDLITQYR